MPAKLKLVLCIALIAATTPEMATAQKVKLKDHKVLIDDTEVFEYKKESGHNASITLIDLKTGEELIFIREDNGGTPGPDARNDDYTVYKFLKEHITVEISKYNTWNHDLDFLLRQGVFDVNGHLNAAKIKMLQEKFDEKISDRRSSGR